MADLISKEQRELDLIKQQLADEGRALKTSIDWLVNASEAEEFLESIHKVTTERFESLLDKYKEAVAVVKAKPKEAEEFKSWLASLKLRDIQHGNIYRERFLDYAYKTVTGKSTGWLQVIDNLLADEKYLDPDFWVRTNWEKIKMFLQEDFLDLVVPYPTLSKKGSYHFENGTIAEKGENKIGTKNYFCRNRSDKFWEVWHEKN
jgi:hypothetical protein